MKSIVIEKNGFDGLKLINRELPQPGPRQVLLRVRAVGLNYRDVEIVLGSYHTPFKFPLVPMSDCLGEVIEVGKDVTRVKKGDRAVVAFWERWHDGSFDASVAGAPLGGPSDGVLSEQFLTSEDRLVVVPPEISDIEAASLPCAASTAWNALVTSGGVKPGEVVLVQGTGGVSLFAMQFAEMAGAQVVITSGSDEKLEKLTTPGVLGKVNYKRYPNWSAEILKLTNGRGVDHVLEVGGPQSFEHSLKSIRPGGQINVIGYLGGVDGGINPLDIFRKQATVRGIPVGSRRMLQELVQAMASTKTKPMIDSVTHWTNAAEALQRLHSGQHFGKVILSF